MALRVQYGCGLCAPDGWTSFDASPTLWLQRLPVIGARLAKRMSFEFPRGAQFGDIVSGLPGIADASCDAVYCSHVLEHLALDDFRTALKNTYRILKPGGTFRCVVPDLEVAARRYVAQLDAGEKVANMDFMVGGTWLGQATRPRSLQARLRATLGNNQHLWMWDERSLTVELENAGFRDVRAAKPGDDPDAAFALVEDAERFREAVALRCTR